MYFSANSRSAKHKMCFEFSATSIIVNNFPYFNVCNSILEKVSLTCIFMLTIDDKCVYYFIIDKNK